MPLVSLSRGSSNAETLWSVFQYLLLIAKFEIPLFNN